MKSRKSRNTWSNRQIWPWSMEWSRAKVNRVLPRERTGHSKHPLPTTQEKTVHMDINRWLTSKSDWLCSLQPKMEKLYTVSKNKTGSWLWLRCPVLAVASWHAYRFLKRQVISLCIVFEKWLACGKHNIGFPGDTSGKEPACQCSSSILSAIRMVSSAYLRLLIFLLAILIPACASSSPVFLMMYSAYKLNKQGDNIQTWHTPFPIWNQKGTSEILVLRAWWGVGLKL